MRSVISDSLNRYLARISEWCKLWNMKMNPNKPQSMIVSRSRTPQPQHPDILIDNVPLTTSDSFKILGITFDSKFTFESHLYSVSSVIAQKLGLLRKSYKIFGDPCVLLRCFNSSTTAVVVSSSAKTLQVYQLSQATNYWKTTIFRFGSGVYFVHVFLFFYYKS